MNKVYAILGPAGSGKSALVQELRRRGIPKIVSHTTRLPKTGEINGVDYHFVSNEEFTKVHPFEKVSYGGYLYGLSKEEVMEKIGKIPALEMYEIFNMGIGMVLAVAPENLTEVLGVLTENDEKAYVIGSVAAKTSEKEVILKEAQA